MPRALNEALMRCALTTGDDRPARSPFRVLSRASGDLCTRVDKKRKQHVESRSPNSSAHIVKRLAHLGNEFARARHRNNAARAALTNGFLRNVQNGLLKAFDLGWKLLFRDGRAESAQVFDRAPAMGRGELQSRMRERRKERAVY